MGATRLHSGRGRPTSAAGQRVEPRRRLCRFVRLTLEYCPGKCFPGAAWTNGHLLGFRRVHRLDLAEARCERCRGLPQRQPASQQISSMHLISNALCLFLTPLSFLREIVLINSLLVTRGLETPSHHVAGKAKHFARKMSMQRLRQPA